MALTPLLLALSRTPQAHSPSGRRRAPGRAYRALLLGLTAGAVYFGGTVYWTSSVVSHYGGLSLPAAVLVVGLLVAYLALFPALFALVLSALHGRMGPAALMLAPLIWVTTELGREHLFTGFPWVLLGYSQTTVLPVAQLASLVGVYGVSALLVLCNASVAYALVGRGAPRVIAVGVALLAVAATVTWGSWRLNRNDLVTEGEAERVGLIQANIAQDDKWNPMLADVIFKKHLALSREAAEQGARFIIWPESATPFYFEEDHVRAEAVRRLARETGAHLLVGSDQIERSQPPRYYVAAFLLRPDGTAAAVYRKMHLVPFGEYVPLKRVLFFVKPLVEAVSDFSPGDAATLLPVRGHPASTAICYEVVYPSLIRRFVWKGSELLTTITNDAWYGESSAPHQHWVQASMRAIEEGRYLARAANTGISGIVDPFGRVLARSGLFDTEVVVGDIRFLTARTVYGRIGYLFPYLCAALTGAALLAAFSSASRRHPARF